MAMKTMPAAFVLAILAAGQAGAAAAFDNSTCKAFLTGNWTTTIDDKVNGTATHSVTHEGFETKGVYAMNASTMIEGRSAPATMNQIGSWDAGPGQAPGSCAITVSPQTEPPESFTVTVIDANSFRYDNGAVSLRDPAP